MRKPLDKIIVDFSKRIAKIIRQTFNAKTPEVGSESNSILCVAYNQYINEPLSKLTYILHTKEKKKDSVDGVIFEFLEQSTCRYILGSVVQSQRKGYDETNFFQFKKKGYDETVLL